MVEIFAHRGASAYFTENTRKAVKKALEMGVDYVEVDIRKTKDNHLVLFHDRNLKRLTGHKIQIKNITLKRLKQIPLKNNGEIITLKEFIHMTKGKAKINLELKIKGIEQRIVKIIEMEKIEHSIMISSFIQSSLKKIKQLNPKIKTALVFRFRRKAIKDAVKLKCSALHPHHITITRWFVKQVHKNNLKINVYPVSTIKRIKSLINIDVDGIITSRPELAKLL